MMLQRWLFRWQHQRRLKQLSDGPLKALLAQIPPLDAPLAVSPLIALDFETTGLNPQQDYLLSIGWVYLDAHHVYPGRSQHLLIRPPKNLPDHSIHIHGLTHHQLQRGCTLCEALDALVEALSGYWPVVHFAPIEQGFLNQALKHCYHHGFNLPMLDTLTLARRLLRHKAHPPQAFRLGALRQRFHLPPHPIHHAREDAIATAELLLALLATEPTWRQRPIGELLTY